MSHPDFVFEIGQKVSVDADFHRHRAVISCETKDGKSIDLDADFTTLEKIHEEIQKRLESQ
jgi:hypothetical protein